MSGRAPSAGRAALPGTFPEASTPPASSGSSARTTRAVLLVALLCGLVHSLLLAPFMGEDEPWHLEYALYVADGHLPTLAGGRTIDRATIDAHPLSQAQVWRKFASLDYPAIEARQAELLDAMRRARYWQRVDWAPPATSAHSFEELAPGFTAVSQPVGYYLLLGAWLAPTRGLSLEARLRWARALSLLLYLLTVWLALQLARELFDDERLAAAAASVVALAPPLAHQAAVVNNDVLATPLAGLLLLLGARALRPTPAGTRRWPLLLAILGTGLVAVLTKLTTIGALLVAQLGFEAPYLARRRKLAALLVAGSAALFVAAAIAAWHVQHNPALPRNLQAFLERLNAGFSPRNLAELGDKLVGRFNWNSRGLPRPAVLAIGLSAGLALASGLLVAARGARELRRSVLQLCVLAALVQLGLVGLRGVAEARYATPAAGALGCLLVAGCCAPWTPRLRPAAARALLLGVLAWSALYLWYGLVVHQELGWDG